MKEKMEPGKKYKLIYSGELVLIAILFLVIGILRITNIMTPSETRLTIFNWVTIFGGSWVVIDFFWSHISKRRRKKECLLDKWLNFPVGVYLIVFDIMCFSNTISDVSIKTTMVCCAFFYIAAIYMFQGIYHYYKPTPIILKGIEEARQEAALNKDKEVVSESKPLEEEHKEETKEE